MDRSELAQLRERAWVNLLRVAPLRAYSRLIRVLSKTPLPRRLRDPVFGRIALRCGMDLSEAELRLNDYRSFHDLFVRRLQPGLRPLADERDAVVCPVDGCLSAMGTTGDGVLIQAKGVSYSLAQLLGDRQFARQLNGGSFITLYLRPKDYHRIHCPVEGTVTGARHIPGKLLPVKPYMVRHMRGLFVRNERLVLRIQAELGTMALVCVAAAGVGNITTAFSRGGNGSTGASQDLCVPRQRGQEVAAFNLGSTVILVFPKGMELLPISPGQEMRMGQIIGQSRDTREQQSTSNKDEA